MVWLNSVDYKNQEYMELRLNAPLYENIRLDFNPLKISDVSGHEPNWKDWHCYRKPLRVYSPDFDILVSYFNKALKQRDIAHFIEIRNFGYCIKKTQCSKVFSHAFLSFECVWESYVF